jgi:hypothetical protein
LLKTDIVRAIAKKGGISYLDADDFVNIMFEAIIQALLREERTASAASATSRYDTTELVKATTRRRERK